MALQTVRIRVRPNGTSGLTGIRMVFALLVFLLLFWDKGEKSIQDPQVYVELSVDIDEPLGPVSTIIDRLLTLTIFK